MTCPLCGKKTTVTDSRERYDGAMVQRRRACLFCGHRFLTRETRVKKEAQKGERHD